MSELSGSLLVNILFTHKYATDCYPILRLGKDGQHAIINIMMEHYLESYTRQHDNKLGHISSE